MAIIFTDGFDAYGTTNGVTPNGMARKWADGTVSSFIGIRDGRIGGKCIAFGPGLGVGAIVGPHQTLIVGFAFKAETQNLATSAIVEFRENANIGINLRRQTNGEWSIYFGNTHLATTSGKAIPIETWCTVELRVKADNSAGEYELKVNGETVLSATGIDTQPASNAYTDIIRIVSTNASGVFQWYDDFYVLEETGATNNTFLLDWKIQTIFPTADSAVECTPSSGGDNFAMVDDNPADGASTYVEGGDEDADLYGHSTTVDGSLVRAVVVNTVCAESDSNPFHISNIVKSDGETASSMPTAIGSTDYVNRSTIFETDPATDEAWTPSAVNAIEFGFGISEAP